MAKLYFRYGAMNCGKTTSLLQVAHNYEERDMKVVVYKPAKDKKGEDKIVSRLGVDRKVDYALAEDESFIKSFGEHFDPTKIACVLVDEVQFFTSSQIDELMLFTKEMNIPVICYGLRSDFKTNGFPGSTRLLEIADDLEELKTICKCGKKATFNARFIGGEFSSMGDQVAIDGFKDTSYEAMCPKCYYEQLGKIKQKKYKK